MTDCKKQGQKKEKKLGYNQLVFKNIINISDKYTPWPRQTEIFNDLLKKYPNKDFWLKVKFGVDIWSMEFFNTPIGEALLKKKYTEFLYTPSEAKDTFDLSEQKHGEDKNIKQKTTLRDFINGKRKRNTNN